MATNGRLSFSLEGTKLEGCIIHADWVQEKYEGTAYPYSKIKYNFSIEAPGAIDTSVVGISILMYQTHAYKEGNYGTKQYWIQLPVDKGGPISGGGVIQYVPLSITKAGTYQLEQNRYMATEYGYGIEPTETQMAVRHNDDGTLYDPVFRNVKLNAYIYYKNNSGHETSQNKSGILPMNEGECGIDIIILPTRVSTVPTAYIGDEITLAIDRQVSTYTHTLTYEMNGIGGTIAEKYEYDEALWVIPTSLIAGIPPESTHGTLTITCYTYSGDVLLATTSTTLIARMDANESAPTFNPIVKDVNPITLALTGNENAIVQYYSNISVDVGAVAKDGATIKAQGGNCGGKHFEGATAILDAVENGDVYVWATDSRGFTAHTTVNKVLIPYTKLTCNLIPFPTATTGIVSFILEGNCYGRSFGAVNNEFTVEYRYRVEDGEYSEWLPLENEISGSAYSFRVDLPEFDYQTNYVFQARVTDLLTTAISNESNIIGKPIFDWGRFDFNFNVKITPKETIEMETDKAIMGTNSYGDKIPALVPCDSTDSLALGYGGYEEEHGATNIFGNEVNIISNGAITFNGMDIAGLINALQNSYDFDATATPGGNYSNASCALTLRGNSLYCRAYASRASITDVGDISDEIMAHIEFNHGGKITGMDYVSGVATTSGPTAGMTMANVVVSGETASFDVKLCNTAHAGRNFLTAFSIPVSIDVSKF